MGSVCPIPEQVDYSEERPKTAEGVPPEQAQIKWQQIRDLLPEWMSNFLPPMNHAQLCDDFRVNIASGSMKNSFVYKHSQRFAVVENSGEIALNSVCVLLKDTMLFIKRDMASYSSSSENRPYTIYGLIDFSHANDCQPRRSPEFTIERVISPRVDQLSFRVFSTGWTQTIILSSLESIFNKRISTCEAWRSALSNIGLPPLPVVPHGYFILRQVPHYKLLVILDLIECSSVPLLGN
jgi:hypothetical protein